MAVEMAKLFISGLSTASNMLSVAIFKGTALLLVTILRIIQLPGWVGNCLLCLLRRNIETAIETALDIAGKWLVSTVSTGSGLVTNATMIAFSSIANGTAEVCEFASETGVGTWSTIRENFWDAVDIIMMKNGTKNE
jgi:hypothetical protein